MKILVIGAHPADPIDLAGGTIYQHTKKGDEVTILTVTDGVRSHTQSDFSIVSISETKIKEFNEAGSILGVGGKFFLGYSDEPLFTNLNAIKDLVGIIREIKPDMVITHHPNEYSHWDHSSCGEMVCRALKAAVKLMGSRHYVPMVYFFAVQFRPETARIGYLPQPPDVLIELDTETLTKKVEAMCCFKSQGIDSAQMWTRINSFEKEMGRADGLSHAEGFSFYYPLKRILLPVNPNKGFYSAEK